MPDYPLLQSLDAAHSPDLAPEEAAAYLSTLTRAEPRTISGEELLRWLAGRGLLAKLDALRADADPGRRNLALTVDALLRRAGTAIDVAVDTDRALIDYAVAIGAFSAEDREALLALATRAVPLVADAGFERVSPAQIRRVRSTP